MGIVAQTYDVRLWEVEAHRSKFKASLRYRRQVKKIKNVKSILSMFVFYCMYTILLIL